MKLAAPNVRLIFPTAALILVSLVLLVHQRLPSSPSTTLLPVSGLRDSAKTRHIVSTNSYLSNTGTIPDFVHFIHLVEPSSNPTLEFSFRQFLAIYSAWYYLQPEVLYIHTNVDERLIEGILAETNNLYTRAISRLPDVKFVHQTSPDHTESGIPIDELPNQSEFVRTDLLGKLGGIYLDDDAYVLQDLRPFRHAGFENVIGRQVNGQVCPAVIMSTPGNPLMEAYHALQYSVFDPHSWENYATDLLTTLAREFQTMDNMVLVLPQDTFFPYAWFPDDLRGLYQVHEDSGAPATNNKDIQNLPDFIKNFELYGPETWRKDWRSSYVLHGWTSEIEKQLTEEDRAAVFGNFDGITPEYVLARNSNFARAVYPAFQHALDNRIIDGTRYNQSQQ